MGLQVNDWIWLRLSSRYGVTAAEAQLGDVFKRWLDERSGTYGFELVDFYALKQPMAASFADAQYDYWSGGALADAVFWIDAFSASRNEPWATNLGSGGFPLRARYGATNSAAIKDSSLYLPGIVGNYAFTPDSAALDITGDIDISAYVQAEKWSGAAATQVLVSKFTTSNCSYELGLLTTGQLRFIVSPNGTTLNTINSTVATGVADNTAKFVRVTLDVDNGAGGYDVRFYLSDDGSAWTQLGATVTVAGATSIFVGTAQLGIGSRSDAASPFAGRVFSATVRNGIGGTAVFDADFVTAPDGAVTFVESTGKTVTVVAVADSADPVLLPHTGTNYLYLPSGTSGNYASTPDAAPLDVVGDLELVMRLSLDDWTPSPSNKYSFSKRATASNQRSWLVEHVTNGAVRLYWSTDGITDLSALSTANLSALADGQVIWLKITLDVDNGAGGNDVKFWWATDQASEPTSWTQLGSTVTTAGVTSIFNSTARLQIGGWEDGGTDFGGKFYRAIVRNGIGGTTVFDANFTTGITSGGQTSFTESSVNAATVTINRSVSGRKSVAVTRPVWLFGTDDYMEVAADPYGTYVRTADAANANVSSTYTAYGTGTATAGAATTLDDTTKTWTVNAYQNRAVRITGGTGVGQVRVIASNTATQLTVTSAWVTIPDTTSTYVVESLGNVNGDIEIVTRCALDNWNIGSNQPIVLKIATGGQNSYRLLVGTSGLITFAFTLDGSTSQGNTSAVVAPFTNGVPYWIRFRRTASTGAWSVDYAADQATEPSTWTPLSSGTGVAGNIWQGTAPIGVGGLNSIQGSAGKVYRAIVRDGIAGTTIVDWAAYGHAASGGSYVDARNTVWVAGSLATVVNANPLNFGSTNSFTLVAILRQWGNPASFARIILKTGYTVAVPSYALLNYNANGKVYFTISDSLGLGINTATTATTFSMGDLTVVTAVRNTAADQVSHYYNNTLASGPFTDPTTNPLAGTNPLLIGGSAGAYNDFELFAIAIIPKALTATEIAKIVAAYQ